MKKVTSVLLVIVLLCSIIPAFDVVSYSAAKDDSAYDCVAYAKARFREIWGFDLHPTGSAGANGYYFNASTYGDVVSSTPRAGALAVWDSTVNAWGHVAIVESVSGSSVTYSEGGYIPYVGASATFNQETRDMSNMSKTNQPFLGYVYVKGTSNISSEPPVIQKVEISNVSTSGYTATCIVDNGFKVSYGDFMIWTEKNGQDDIQQYRGTLTDNKIVINVKASAHNGETGKYITHLYIWYNGGTKSISVALPAVVLADKEPPQVSNMKITNVTESGYTVTCDVTDASDVILADFLVWTSQNGQDDMGSFQGTISKNNVVTINIKSSDHNSEKGEYITHLYIYDSAGNSKGYAFPSVNLSGYKITLNSNDESNTTLNKKKTYDVDFVLDNYIPTRDGYNFLGWSTDSDATEHEYLPGDTYSENKDITLYAVWEEVIYTNLIQGAVTSFGDGNEEIILKKNDSTQESYAVVAFTSEDTYSVCDPEGKIEPGEYILSVSKENHVTREYNVTIGDETVNLDIQLNLIGDINGDGKINVMDYSSVLRHAKKTENLEDYAFLCADVDGNGRVTVSDYARILRHVKKTDPLW